MSTGTTLTGIDIAFVGATSIAGTITADVGGAPVAGAVVAVWVPDGTYLPTATATTAVDGTYTVNGIPAGPYRIEVRAPTGTGLIGEWYADADRRSTATIVAVPSGATTTIDAALAATP